LKEIDIAAIKKADVVIFNFNKRSGEGRDVPFDAGSEEIADLKKITAINKNVVVLMNSSNVLPFEWIKEVKGLLWCYFLGQERGNALADIISGKVSPSGKLPFTIEKNFKEGPDPDFNYLGNIPFWMGNNQYKKYWLGETNEFDTAFTNYVKPHEAILVPYKEETLIGYRWYDYHKIPVHFPFGFGLSYSKFMLNKLKVENNVDKNGEIIVEVEVQNTGKVLAKEVVQIYVGDKQSSVVRAPKELKAFQKTELKPGEKTTLRFVLDKSALAFWDESTRDWKIEPGEFVVLAGNSSADLLLQESLLID
jgi:beta-glucosidase